MAKHDEKKHPDRFVLEIGNLGLERAEIESIMNQVVRASLDRIKGIAPKAGVFEQWVSFEQWQSFGQAG